jgi:hypothetical protein
MSTKPINFNSGGIDFAYVKDINLTWSSALTKRKRTDHIQVHHTVGDYGTEAKLRSLHQNKQTKGHKGIGYSYMIFADGTIYRCRGLEYAHGSVKDSLTTNEAGIGANQRSVAVCFNGDMRKDDLPTPEQYASAVTLIQDILAYYDDIPILGHNEVPTYINRRLTGKSYATACPCIAMDALRTMIAGTKPLPKADAAFAELPDDPEYPATYKYTGATYTNIRNGPGIKHPVIGQIGKGDVCKVADAQADSKYMWYAIRLGDMDGWCVANYLEQAD